MSDEAKARGGRPKAPSVKAAKRPPGLLCATCARRALFPEGPPSETLFKNEIRVFQLKLRDWLNVPTVELRPCLSVCPQTGMTVERRGKTMVLDQSAIEAVQNQFDPTRQLSFLDEKSTDDTGE